MGEVILCCAYGVRDKGHSYNKQFKTTKSLNISNILLIHISNFNKPIIFSSQKLNLKGYNGFVQMLDLTKMGGVFSL